MKKFLKDFKDFALKGNIVDLAVGVVVGGAFNAIITSLVNNIIMPLVSVLFHSGDLATLNIVLKEGDAGSRVVLQYGAFLQSVLSFLIVAFSVFVALRVLMKLKKNKPIEVVPEKAQDIIILEEIRDLLAKNVK